MEPQASHGMHLFHPDSAQCGEPSLKNNCGRPMRALQRKQPSPSNGRPRHGVLHELPVKEKAALVALKIGDGGVPSVSLNPEVQGRCNRSIQRLSHLRRNGASKELFGQVENNQCRFTRPPHALNALQVAAPECGVGRSAIQEPGDLEEYGQPAPVPQNVPERVQYLKQQAVLVAQGHEGDVSPLSQTTAVEEVVRKVDVD